LVFALFAGTNGASFVTRNGGQLYLDGSPFRYSGCNIYWLGLDENVGGVAYPTQFRVDDVFATALELGTNVVRGHTLGVSTGNSKSVEPNLNVFNRTALQFIDYAVSVASKVGIRLVVPLTDNYHYYHGGKHDFTDWRKLDESRFYTDATVIADFKNYIRELLTHSNQYTGVVYSEDPTVLAWETGNEISPPASWTQQIADYIKSIDKNHLVMDGRYGVDQNAVTIPSVDLYSDHFYPMDPNRVISGATLCKNNNKVYTVGEYGWASGSNLQQFLSTIETQPVAGDTFWSLFPHADINGFVQHSDGFTLHYPGDSPAMRADAQMIRNHAYKMRGITVPEHMLPPAPLITRLSAGSIAWRGAAGSANYTVESAPNSSGPWTVICNKCATDNNTPFSSSAVSRGSWYRISGVNLGGVAGPYSPTQQCN